jgi:uncharacterized protein (DUF2336 family)
MTMPASLAGEVDEAVSGGDPARRLDVLRRITALFVEQAPCLKDAHVEVFDEVILRLARNLEFRARVSLADQMAAIENAPTRVVNDLARDDDIRIAEPILERSTRLTEDDLVEIAARKGQGHLLALSRRATLPEKVTDILVDRGDQQVVRSVAGNEGARFSEGGFAHLLEKARSDETLQSVMRARADIPVDAKKQLVAIARERVREALASEMGGAAAAAIDAAVASAASALEGSADPVLPVDQELQRRRAGERASYKADEATILQWLREGRIDAALTAMAELAKVPAVMMVRAYHSPTYDPLLFITRSLGFGWSTFKVALAAKAGRDLPDAVLNAAFKSFQSVSVANAGRVVHFTAVRERAANGEAA